MGLLYLLHIFKKTCSRLAISSTPLLFEVIIAYIIAQPFKELIFDFPRGQEFLKSVYNYRF
jgi:hypothetical protein